MSRDEFEAAELGYHFNVALARRLAEDLMDAVAEVTAEDPHLRVHLLDGQMRDALIHDALAVVRVRTQRPDPSDEGCILLRPGMCARRIADLIREKIQPKA